MITWILLFSAAMIFYVRTIPQISLSERAIVIGLGIDFDEEKGYTMTAQIINTIKQGPTGGASDSYGIVEATADTMAVALGMIAEKTGLNVSLSQCNVLILGKSLLETDVFPNINYLLQIFQIPEQSVLAATDTAAGELLRAKPVLAPMSSFYLQQTLTTMNENEGVLNTDVKDFSGVYLADNGAPSIAMITKRELPPADVGGQTAESSSDKYYEFDYGKCVVFSKGKTPFILDNEDTESVNFILRKLKQGGETVKVGDYVYTVALTSKKYKSKAKFENGRLNYSGELKIKYYISEVKNMGVYNSVEDIPDGTIAEIEKEIKRQIENRIRNTYEKTAAQGFDVFGVYGAAYSAEGVKWKNAAEGNYFDLIDFNIAAEIKVTRK